MGISWIRHGSSILKSPVKKFDAPRRCPHRLGLDQDPAAQQEFLRSGRGAAGGPIEKVGDGWFDASNHRKTIGKP